MGFFESLHFLWLIFVTIFYFIAGIALFRTRFREGILKFVKISFYLLLFLTILSIATSPTIVNAIKIIIRTSSCLVFSLYFFWLPMGNFKTYTDHLWDKSTKFGKPVFMTSLVILILFVVIPLLIDYFMQEGLTLDALWKLIFKLKWGILAILISAGTYFWVSRTVK